MAIGLIACFLNLCSQVNWETVIQQIEDSISVGNFSAPKETAISYLQKAKISAHDTITVQLYFAMAIGHFREDPRLGLPFLDSALTLTNSVGKTDHSIRYYNAKSTFLKKLGELNAAKETSLSAYESALESAPDYVFLSARNVSINYRLLGRYDSALHFAIIADSTANGQKEKYLALQGISNIYTDMGELEKSAQILPRLIELGESDADKMYDLLNLGNVLGKMAKYDTAILVLNQSVGLAETLNDTIELANIHGLIGQFHQQRGNYDQALSNLTLSLDFAEQESPTDILATTYLSLARTRYELGQLQAARMDAQKALELAASADLKELMMGAYEALAQIDSALGNYQAAFEWQAKGIALRNELNSLERIEAIEELQTRYETEKKEQEIALLQRDNQLKDLTLRASRIWIFLIASLSILSAGILILMLRQNRLKRTQEKAQLEQRLLRSQMNPHFIFNALTSIQNFILTNQTKEAGKYLGKFGDLTRDILEASRADLVTVEQELRMIKNYVDLESVRFDKDVELTIHLDEKIADDFDQIPPLFLQPFVENAIKHGFKDRPTGQVILDMKAADSVLKVRILDNGVGLTESSSLHTSRALTIAKERLQLLSRKFKTSSELTIQNRTDESGVMVEFELPLVS